MSRSCKEYRQKDCQCVMNINHDRNKACESLQHRVYKASNADCQFTAAKLVPLAGSSCIRLHRNQYLQAQVVDLRLLGVAAAC